MLTSGDMVNELFLLVNGTAEVISPNEASLASLARADGVVVGGWASAIAQPECAPGDEACLASMEHQEMEFTLTPSSPIR